MCHRFNVKQNLRQIAEPFENAQLLFDLVPETDRYPMSDVVIIRLDAETDDWIIELRQWGWLPFHWEPSANYKTRKKYQRERFNARSETVDSTWGFRRAFESQRCVLVGSEFYEPFVGGGEARYTVEGGLFFFAGLWDHWEGDGDSVDSCTMLTTEANPLVAANRTGRLRQPVILTDIDQVARYCNLEVTERAPLADLLTPLSADAMTIHHPG
ncbi:MAG: putative SOS response-associated peptidase YedK [Porticoccaceae bacterium]|jgi:putative SOS response-associated peptidase YedK